ncbi:MAG: acyl-ACP--UDP-N-acetylglucosamine O-acyltransferase, partial [Lautropia sp.]|nr:acyl-ACP--UDP-N-acetylglucosamine O-acyltransferase [Lautropia sp.]
MSASLIHPTALVDSGAELDSTVQVGPYAIIGKGVRIDAGTVVGPHVVIEGDTRIGRNNRFFQFSSIGAVPQDKKYAGEPTRVEIGDGNTIRECVTINRGTAQDVGTTRLGDDNWLMAYVHIAHDCQVGNHTIFANTTNLAGHVHIGDWAILGGNSQVHQFCKIGAHAMTGTGTIVLQDITPYTMVTGNPA